MALQYAQTAEQNQNVLQTYGTGLKDLFAIFFYFLICIIFHAIIQEYALDVSNARRLSRRKIILFLVRLLLSLKNVIVISIISVFFSR